LTRFVHWVDASTLFSAEGLHDSILTVLAFRPEFKTPWPVVADQTSLALNRLTRRQVSDLMRQKAGWPQALVERVYDRSAACRFSSKSSPSWRRSRAR
jgi:hypothetical protein